VQGPGATYVMAAFTHLNPVGSRFSNGQFGVYYAGRRLETAIYETIYHLEKMLCASGAASDELDQRVLMGKIEGKFVDLTSSLDKATILMDPNDYTRSQEVAVHIKNAGQDGIYFNSVRDPGHPALAVFRPLCVLPPRQERHLTYHWDGKRISKYFDYLQDDWVLV